MTITKKTPIYVYGYSLRGINICQILRQQELNVIAYIDKNAERYLTENIDIPIYNLDQLKTLNLSKSLVFVAVSNPFKHKEIAKTLTEYGFRFIVCKIFDDDDTSQQRNEIYERIVDVLMTLPIENMDVPQFENTKQAVSTVNITHQDIISVPVPVNLLFGLTEDLYYESLKYKDDELLSKVPDKSILYFNISRGLFTFFQTDFDENKYEKYVKIYTTHRMSQMFEHIPAEADQKEFAVHLKDRYAIYQEMEKLFAKSINFFGENPSSVTWNSEGYFNLEDGNNRACFLLEKGMFEIPCKMKWIDYEKWLNTNEKIENVKKTLSNLCEMIKSPISHPIFQEYQVQYYTWSYKKLKRMCEWFWDNDLNIAGKNILEIYSKNDLCGQHMARMGAAVTILESCEWLDLHKTIDDLLNIKAIKYISEIEDMLSISYDLILCDFSGYVKKLDTVKFVFSKGIFEVSSNNLLAFEEWIKTLSSINKCIIISKDLVGDEVIRLVYIETSHFTGTQES